jgi:hypothetical protein
MVFFINIFLQPIAILDKRILKKNQMGITIFYGIFQFKSQLNVKLELFKKNKDFIDPIKPTNILGFE